MADEKSGLSMVWIVLLVVIIAAGTSFGFMYFFNMQNNDEPARADQEMGPTYNLGEFTANLSAVSGYQFIRATIVVEVNDSEVIEELDKREPQVRDEILSILRRQSAEDLEEPGGEVIKSQIEMSLNQLLPYGEIKNVWFTQLVIQ